MTHTRRVGKDTKEVPGLLATCCLSEGRPRHQLHKCSPQDQSGLLAQADWAPQPGSGCDRPSENGWAPQVQGQGMLSGAFISQSESDTRYQSIENWAGTASVTAFLISYLLGLPCRTRSAHVFAWHHCTRASRFCGRPTVTSLQSSDKSISLDKHKKNQLSGCMNPRDVLTAGLIATKKGLWNIQACTHACLQSHG